MSRTRRTRGRWRIYLRRRRLKDLSEGERRVWTTEARRTGGRSELGILRKKKNRRSPKKKEKKMIYLKVSKKRKKTKRRETVYSRRGLF